MSKSNKIASVLAASAIAGLVAGTILPTDAQAKNHKDKKKHGAHGKDKAGGKHECNHGDKKGAGADHTCKDGAKEAPAAEETPKE